MLWAGPQHNVEPLTPANPSSSAPIPAYLAPGLPMEELMSSTFTWYWLQKLGARTPPHVLLLWTPTQIHLPSKRAPTATQGPARLSLLQPWRSLAEADLWRCPRWGNPYRVSTSGLAQVAGGREAAVWHEVLSVGQGPRGCRLAQMPQKKPWSNPPSHVQAARCTIYYFRCSHDVCENALQAHAALMRSSGMLFCPSSFAHCASRPVFSNPHAKNKGTLQWGDCIIFFFFFLSGCHAVKTGAARHTCL